MSTLWVLSTNSVNSHVLIEEYTEKTPQIEEILPKKEAEKVLMLLSTQSIPSLQKMREKLVSKQTIYDKNSLISVATIQNQFYAHHKLKSVVMANSIEDCVNQLKAITKENVDGLKQKDLVSAANRSEKGFVFVFSGQRPQTKTMNIQLYERYEIFRILLNKFGLIEIIKYWSVQPFAIIEHSTEEVVGAYSIRVYTLEEAICILYYKSTLQQKTIGNNNMLAIGTFKEEAEKILDELLAQKEKDDIVIAAINTSLSVILVGSLELIIKLESLVDKNKDPIKEELLTKLKKFILENAGKPTTIPLYSTVTSKLYDTTKETMNEDYL